MRGAFVLCMLAPVGGNRAEGGAMKTIYLQLRHWAWHVREWLRG
jgi:hypothetical protein